MANVPIPLINAIVDTESSGNPLARNESARGLGQFIPSTGARYGLHTDADFYNPTKSIHAVRDYLSDLYDRFGDWNKVIMAYNAGEGAVSSGTIPQSTRETYLPKVINYWATHAQAGEGAGPVGGGAESAGASANLPDPDYGHKTVNDLMRGRGSQLTGGYQNVSSSELQMLHDTLDYAKQAYAQGKHYSDRATELAQTSPLESPEGQWAMLAQLSGHPDLAPIGTNMLNQMSARQNAQFQAYQQSAERALTSAGQMQSTANQTLANLGVRMDNVETRKFQTALHYREDYSNQANKLVPALESYNLLRNAGYDGVAKMNVMELGRLVHSIIAPGEPQPQTRDDLLQYLSKNGFQDLADRFSSWFGGTPVDPGQIGQLLQSLGPQVKAKADALTSALQTGRNAEGQFGSDVITPNHARVLGDFLNLYGEGEPFEWKSPKPSTASPGAGKPEAPGVQPSAPGAAAPGIKTVPEQPEPPTWPAPGVPMPSGAADLSTNVASLFPQTTAFMTQPYSPQFFLQTLGLG